MFSFCDKITAKKQYKPYRKLFGHYTFSCFDDINDTPNGEWDEAVKDHNIFLSFNYLRIVHLEQTENFRFRYVIVYNRKRPIGVIYFQINDFSASLFGEMVAEQIKELQSKRTSLFKKYIEHNGTETIMRLVTCGNNFVSGEHGFYLDVNSKRTRFKLVEGVIDCVARAEKLRGKISAILVKDFYEEGFGNKDCWYCTRFVHFNVEPNMIVKLPDGVKTLAGYLDHFSKKYRHRAKHILKLSAPLVKRRLTFHEIEKYKVRLHDLYSQVYQHAKFKLVHLSQNYFREISLSHPDTFYIDAWFLGDTMLSFASGFNLPNEVEGHYIGFEYKDNKEYDLYQTILYSYIEQAILTDKARVNLGRTASEIKTTVGAKPHELICYIKPQNTVSKIIMKPFMQYLQPSEWVPRHPFKGEEHNRDEH